MYDACDNIIDFIKDEKFFFLTQNSIPANEKVPGSYSVPQMMVFDFAICNDGPGKYAPRLVEMQGFASLYAFQILLAEMYEKHFYVPPGYTPFLGNNDRESCIRLLKKVILGSHAAENVVLLEIEPTKQKTRIDFILTKQYTGVDAICITELIAEGKQLFYLRDGKKTRITRIYNRMIFDELHQRPDLQPAVDITKPFDVEWVPHPDWFYRISKYTIPFISHPSVPETYFLNEVKQLPRHLDDYVLKPLFSFAGQGVVIDVEQRHIDAIVDPENWILQRKVDYADAILTPTGPAKAEIRLMYLWEEGKNAPEPVINLARISKGKMIGTRYNQDKDWVGGTIAFFEQ